MTDPLRDQLQSSLGTAYTLHRELGGGGMSRVFMADDIALGRPIVLKVLAPELAAGISAERFAREIRMAAALQQANIVPVHSAGTTANGLPYYTMPWVEGESLRHRTALGPMAQGEAISTLRDVARALAYAHARGIVHRDIKPENVLLSEGTAVVTDFGIAKAIDVSSAQPGEGSTSADTMHHPARTLTTAGVVIGTPAYMSPEQVTGETIDQRTDLYAWGLLAYELLTGHHPFAERMSPRDILVAQLSEVPSSAPLERAGVSAPLAALVLRCLEKDRALRPASAGEILTTLDGSERRDAGATPWLRSGLRGRRTIAAIAALVVLSAIVGLVLRAQHASTSASSLQSLAVLPFENIGGDSGDVYLAHGITNELSIALGRVPDIRIASGVSARVLQSRGLTATDLARTLDVQGVLSGTIRRAGGTLRVTAELVDARNGQRVWGDEFEESRTDVFVVEDKITQAIVSALRPRLTGGVALRAAKGRGTVDPEAYDLYLRGRYFWSLRSEAGMHRAIDYFERAAGRDSDYVLAISGLADAYAVSAFYSYVTPSEGYGRAKLLATRALRLDSTRAEPHASLGYVALYYDWNEPEAERQLQRAIQLDSTYATAYQWMGNYLIATSHPDEALASLKRAQRADPLNRVSVGAVCWGMVMVRQYRDALPQCGKAIELDSTFAVARLWRGQALEALGDTAAALAELETATRLSGRAAVFVAALAHANARFGDPTRARALVAEVTGPKQRYVPSYEVALAFAALGEKDQAIAWLERAYRERSHSMAFLRVDAGLDPLRNDSRFAQIVERTGLH